MFFMLTEGKRIPICLIFTAIMTGLVHEKSASATTAAAKESSVSYVRPLTTICTETVGMRRLELTQINVHRQN